MYMYIQITHYCCQINNIITVYKGKIVLCEYALTKMYYILYIYYMIMVRLYFQWNYTICMVNLQVCLLQQRPQAIMDFLVVFVGKH